MPVETKTPDATCIVIDGAAIIQMMKPAVAKTFYEFTQQVFILYISSQLRRVSRVDLVFGNLQGWLLNRHRKSQASFTWHGKKTAWSTWKSLPELTDAQLMLADGSSFHEKPRCSKSHLPELLQKSMSRERSTRVVTSWGRQCYQTLCCHHQLTWSGWREMEHISSIGLHCHIYQNHATNWSLVAARVAAEMRHVLLHQH